MTNDNLIRPAFTSKYLEEEKKEDNRRTISISMNKVDDKLLKDCQKILNQSKESTAIKKMMQIAYDVLHEEKTRKLLHTVFKNKRNNKRNNINEFD